MRRLADAERIRRLMRALAATAATEGAVYFTGGATAVLYGWRGTTVDVDLVMVPEDDAVLREIPAIKERLEINVELASPAHFLPELPGWQDRSLFMGREGSLSFYHYDPYAQALAKIERGHRQDRADVSEMLRLGLVEAGRLRELFGAIEPSLYRFPAIDSGAFRRALGEALAGGRGGSDRNPA